MNEEQQFSEARRRQMPGLRLVYGQYVVREGILRPADPHSERRYFPAAAAAAVRDLAAVAPGSEAHAIKFAQRWGILGNFSNTMSGEPVAWLWAHASGIRMVLQLATLIHDNADEAIAGCLTASTEMHFSAVEELQRCLTGNDAKGAELAAQAAFAASRTLSDEPDELPGVVYGLPTERVGYSSFPPQPERLKDAAKHAIETILNRNQAAGVHREIRYEDDTPTARFASPSLVGYIYHHLAEIISGPSSECRYCGTPFRPTHGRQRFCPPEPWVREGGESRCALAYRARKHRAKKPKEEHDE